ncbi:hypothetical protein [Nonomuraea sp. NPDC005501]|uniref:hypothetical protein n=1 Tax=Nonomuraea sp. NPDC005501 TaxID=3156884 RepID=UPI0033A4A5A6
MQQHDRAQEAAGVPGHHLEGDDRAAAVAEDVRVLETVVVEDGDRVAGLPGDGDRGAGVGERAAEWPRRS